MGRKYCIIFIILLTATLRLKAQNYLEFVENKGQWEQQVKFKGQLGQSGSFFLEKNGFKVLLHNPADMQRIIDGHHNAANSIHRPDRGPESVITQQNQQNQQDLVLHSHAYQMQFAGAADEPQIIPDKGLATTNNYFIGNDPSKWASNCKVYQAVTYKNVYPNIDVRYYVESGRLKYDLVVYPGGDVSKIAMKYEGANALRLKNKDLIIGTSVGELKELSPFTYQYDEKGKKEITTKYSLNGNVLRFDVKNYDPNSILFIDSNLIFCSFSGSSADNWGFTATYGPDGSMYGGGIVMGSGWPVSSGAFQTTFGGGSGSGCFTGNIDIGIIN